MRLNPVSPVAPGGRMVSHRQTTSTINGRLNEIKAITTKIYRTTWNTLENVIRKSETYADLEQSGIPLMRMKGQFTRGEKK
jgi:hypothetical protein